METWTQTREFVSKHVAPINTVFFGVTGIVIPLVDFLRPRSSYLVAGAAVLAFLLITALAIQRWGPKAGVPTSLIVALGICAALFTVGATASREHAEQGGLLVSTVPSLQSLQGTLLGLRSDVQATNHALNQQNNVLADLRSGRSDDPRVTLKNMGIPWEYAKLQAASLAGDLRVMELFLAGGMPAGDFHSATLAYVFIRAGAPRSAEQLALLDKYHVDLHGSQAVTTQQPSPLPPSLYVVAVNAKNLEAQRYLLSHGSAKGEYDRWVTEQNKRPRESGYWM